MIHRCCLRSLLTLACLVGMAGSVWSGEEHGARAAKAVTKAAVKPPEAAAAAKPDGAAAGADSLDVLRTRLAERLGAATPPEARHPNVLRVSNRAGDTVVAAASPQPTRAAPRPAAHAAEPAATAAADAHGAPHAAHWAYQGPVGPEAWGQMKPEFRTCSVGQRQSPIDIRGGIQVELEPIQFDYRATGFSVVDNGHTVQVNLPPGNAITVTGRRYDLLQFHFHRPSEERINGRQFDMVAHLVHKDPDGRLAVVAVLLERGAGQALIQTVWNALPLEKGEEVPAAAVIDLAQLLPTDRRYYTYMGSLTTPPCSEGVLWMVMKQPVQLSTEQIGIFARLYPMNARPIQQVSGRLIKESN
jgi:carbonic anhydrase